MHNNNNNKYKSRKVYLFNQPSVIFTSEILVNSGVSCSFQCYVTDSLVTGMASSVKRTCATSNYHEEQVENAT